MVKGSIEKSDDFLSPLDHVKCAIFLNTRHFPTMPLLPHFSLLSSGYPVGGAHKMASAECLNARGDNIEKEESSDKYQLNAHSWNKPDMSGQKAYGQKCKTSSEQVSKQEWLPEK